MTIRFDAAELGRLSFSAFWLCATVNRFCLSQIIKRAPVKFFVLGAALHGVLLIVGVFSGSAIVLCVMVGSLGFVGGHFIPVLVSECAVGYEGKTTFTTSFVMFLLGVSRIAAPLLMAFASTRVSFVFGMMIPAASAFAAAACGLIAQRTEGVGSHNRS
jgi:fucose permease